jgi:uncharacterized delta-60 repeat protein
LLLAMMTVLIWLGKAPVLAADGDLDTTFGNGGRVITDVSGNDNLTDIALAPDGKIVAVGLTFAGTSSPRIAVVRYNSNGTLDTTFGTGGKVITQISFGAVANAVVVQPDGKVLVGGHVYVPSSVDTSFVLLRYNTDGSLDASFGSGGIVTTNIGDDRDSMTALALRADGRIVAVGSRAFFRPPGEERNSDAALARYNPDGSLDTTFGSGGITVTDFGPYPDYFADDATSVNLLQDGRFVICGDSDGMGYYDFLTARYSADGVLDMTFGSGGFTKNDLGNGFQDGSDDSAVQADGRIVSVGAALPDSYDLDMAMIRYNTDGSLDQTFGSGGRVIFGLESLKDEEFTSVTLQSNGKILALGDSNSYTNSGFLLFRFNTDGSHDATFGNNGMVRTTFSGGVQTAAVVTQPDGKILAAGYSPLYQTSDFVLARYVASHKLPTISNNRTGWDD